MSDKEIELETFVNESDETQVDDPITRNQRHIFGLVVPYWIDKSQVKVTSIARATLSFAWRKKLAIALATLVLVLVVTLGFCLYRIEYGDNGTIYVKNTVEYQITDLGSLKTWNNRTAIVEQWIKTFNANSQYIQLDIENGKELVRNEYSLTVHSCGVNTYIRVREYVTGPDAGKSTLDIKGNSKFHWRACVYPYWPPLDKISASSQKCEKDVHECEHKYSRETRIYFDEYQSFNVCADVFRYFPFAGEEKAMSTKIPIIQNEIEPWWIYRYTGSVGSSDYEISFTLRYHKEEDALYETNAPFDGEWSIRITTKGHGYDEKWDEEFKADVEATYNALVKQMSHDTCHFF